MTLKKYYVLECRSCGVTVKTDTAFTDPVLPAGWVTEYQGTDIHDVTVCEKCSAPFLAYF